MVIISLAMFQEVEDVLCRQLAALHLLEKQKSGLGPEQKSKGVSNLQPGRMGGQSHGECYVWRHCKKGHDINDNVRKLLTKWD